MKHLLILTTLILLGACETDPSTDIPDCINEILSDTDLSSSLMTVRVQETNNELHYWLNTGFTAFDGVEYIVNADCDTICSFCGFCLPPACASDYDVNNWINIWEQ